MASSSTPAVPTARLADIAAQAGVSEATVSRVFNGKTGVSATTRQTVLAALDVLGYDRPVRLPAPGRVLLASGDLPPVGDEVLLPADTTVWWSC